MPALDALQARFAAANTQVLGASVDSIHCHANWAESLGGISFPLLADFHPKGAVAESFGMYLADKGITDRATVIIDAGGTVRHASSVTPAGERNMEELAAQCEEIDKAYDGKLDPAPAPDGVASGTTLYVRSNCGFSRRVLTACTNLHLDLTVKNVSEDKGAMAELEKASGKQQAPCLISGGKAMLESADIIKELVTRSTGF